MNIGLIDFDFLSTKKLCNYNFGVLLVSSYYLEQGSKVRLIINLNRDNLLQYDKIYIFKDYKTRIQPVNLIKDYYSLPVEEYGEGFLNRPLYPTLPNLIYTRIRTDIYKPIIYYIKNGGEKFSLDEKWRDEYFPTKIFFDLDGEMLLREIPTKKKLLIYDDPSIFFITELGKQKMTELLKKSIIKFVKPLRIGIIPSENWEYIFNQKKIISFKERLYGKEDDPYLDSFVDWVVDGNVNGKIKIAIQTKDGLKWFKRQGGNIYGNYGNYRLKRDDKTRVNDSTSKEDISIGYEWFATKRFTKNNRRGRERTSETQRRKYLPSEYERRYKERRAKYNAIKRGR